MAVRSWYRPSSNPLSRLQSLVTMLSVSLCLIEVFFVSPCSQWAPLYSRGFVQQRQSSCLTLSTTQRKTQDMHSVRYLGTHHKSHTRDLELKNILPQAWSMIFRGNWCHLLFHAPGVFVIVVSWVGVGRLKLFKTQPNFLRPFSESQRVFYISVIIFHQYVKAIYQKFRSHLDLKADRRWNDGLN